MPPPATHLDPADEVATPPTLDDASARLESALARLEALVEAGPLQSDLFRAPAPDEADAGVNGERDDAIDVRLEAARDRERALEAAAAAASMALGRAMAEVRHVLDARGTGGEDGDEDVADEALDPMAGTAEEPQP